MKKIITLYTPKQEKELLVLYTESLIKAGFPSPAEDHTDLKLDLNKELIKNPSATFFARVSGESMIGDGVGDGDILVVDRSVEPADGQIAVCFLDGEFTLKRVRINGKTIILVPANPSYKQIEVTADNDFSIWGVVRYIIKKV
ncbi:MAG: translesion error-prone DNA polymerase V autoproteolytic subunit [Rikenellaceae bacterium]|nr:translesion error-prone DNA polymerase V autoproteolytic subunit [Rikenellaceae bacterium]